MAVSPANIMIFCRSMELFSTGTLLLGHNNKTEQRDKLQTIKKVKANKLFSREKIERFHSVIPLFYQLSG